MAKKKDGASKKSEQKKKSKIVEDKTFGLKNKNKSAKVKAHIQSVTKNVMNSGDPKERKLMEDRKRQKANAKARKKAMEEERNALFGEALMAVKKKTSTSTKGLAESKGRDHEDGKAKKPGQSRAMKM
jgi:DNA polymerase III alpha subunit